MRAKLKQAGIYRSNGREHFRGMVTVPLHSIDLDGSLHVSGLYGLRIDMSNGGAREQSVGSGVFNAEALSRFEELIVCDEVQDAWALIAAGHDNAVCTVHCSLTRLALARTKRVLVANGPEASDRLADSPALAHCERFELRMPQDVSVHQYAMEHRQDPEPFASLIRGAPWYRAPQPMAEPPPPEPQKPAVTPLPALPEEDLEIACSDSEVSICIESRRWRIRGLQRNVLSGVLRVNVLVMSQATHCFHVDTFDLYHARSRRAFASEAAAEIGDVP